MASLSFYRRRREEARVRQLTALDKHYSDVEKGISERVRYIAFGIAAVVYALFSSDSVFATHLVENYRWPLLLAAITATLTITADFFRQHCRYVASEKAYKHPGYDWNTKSFHYRASELLRYFVLAFLAVAVISFLIAMFGGLQKPPATSPDESRLSALETAIAEHERAAQGLATRLEALESRPLPASRTRPCAVGTERWSSNGDYQLTCTER